MKDSSDNKREFSIEVQKECSGADLNRLLVKEVKKEVVKVKENEMEMVSNMASN